MRDLGTDARAGTAGAAALAAPSVTEIETFLQRLAADPPETDDADRIEFDRPDAAAHLAFGHGVHFCIGAALARMQGEVAFTTLVRRFPEVALAVAEEEVQWRRAFVNGPVALPVRLAP